MTLLNPNLIKFLAYKGGCNIFVFEIIDEHFRHYESENGLYAYCIFNKISIVNSVFIIKQTMPSSVQ